MLEILMYCYMVEKDMLEILMYYMVEKDMLEILMYCYMLEMCDLTLSP